MSQDIELSEEEFERFRKLIYSEFGISLGDRKRTLVQSRLRKWLNEFNLDSYGDLYDRLTHKNNSEELILLANAITTNVTSFFREEGQWIYLKEHLDTIIDHKEKKIRIWSAGCSSGQEPYTIIIFLMEHLDNFSSWDVKILATDLSEDILVKAMEGCYTQKELESMPKNFLNKYFDLIEQKGSKKYQVKDTLKSYVLFRSFNLITGKYTMFKNKFDFIFCRNVMIYFDRQTQNTLIANYFKLLKQKGLLFIGHSESIQENQKGNLVKLVAPSIYQIKGT